MDTGASLKLLVQLGLRSIVTHRIKSLIVGSLMLFGTLLVVVGTSMLDSIQSSMQQSIVSSLAGHLQVYDKDAKDPLALFGGIGGGIPDIGEIPDFSVVKQGLSSVPEVKAVVPMGLGNASFTTPGDLDEALGALRTAVGGTDQPRIASLAGRVRQLLVVMKEEETAAAKISSDTTKHQDALRELERTTTDAYWGGFDAARLQTLDDLDTKVAPLGAEGRYVYMRFVGTDLDVFEREFDRFHLVTGTAVPKGKRGLLVNKGFYEKLLKNAVAREIDALNAAVFKEHKVIANDPLLREQIARTARQYQRVLYQLDSGEAAEVLAALQHEMPQAKGDLPTLLQEFLRVDDTTLASRTKLFYDVIAPKIELHPFNVGDVITMRAYTKSGYLRAVNVRVYGVFEFTGLEDSKLAGNASLSDMMTFRDVYGLPSAAARDELAAMKANVGVKELDRGSAEDALFGAASAEAAAPGEARVAAIDEFAGGAKLSTGDERTKRAENDTFSEADVEKGLALNAAIILRDPTHIHEGLLAVAKAIIDKGLKLQVVDWRSAAGIIGQFILVVRAVLFIAIFIIFLVAIVIINNSMVMATLERVSEIGTMRALGAQRTFVLWMFLFETAVLGTLAGGLGALIGTTIITVLGHTGIPASNDFLVFLFAGPRLYPAVGLINVGLGLVIILLVSVSATLYPARIATRIQPVVAMQGKE